MKKLLSLLFVAIGAAFFCNPFGIAYPKLMYINYTGSLPNGIYIAIPGLNIRSGDIVAFNMSSDLYEFSTKRGYISDQLEKPYLLKKVMTPGNIYENRDNKLYINREYIGPIHPADPENRPLDTIPEGIHVVPEHMLFAFTPHPQSFDSRNYGPIDDALVISRVIPLVTFTYQKNT